MVKFPLFGLQKHGGYRRPYLEDTPARKLDAGFLKKLHPHRFAGCLQG